MIPIERRFISLFGGIGGFDKPLIERGWKCAAYYDIDRYATACGNSIITKVVDVIVEKLNETLEEKQNA